MKNVLNISLLFLTLNFYGQKNFSFDEVRPKYDPILEIKEEKDTSSPLVFDNDIKDSLESYVDSLAVLYKERPMYIKGFSVMVYNGFDVAKAKKMRSHLLSLFPEEKAFMDYVPPNSRLKVGQFTKKIFAQQLKERLMEKGFTGLIVVPEKIKIRD